MVPPGNGERGLPARADVAAEVFVDDLDRCLPEKAIEVLEAIKLFLEAPGTVFVLGMDREVVERGVESRYRGFFRQVSTTGNDLPISGDTYLQVFVNGETAPIGRGSMSSRGST